MTRRAVVWLARLGSSVPASTSMPIRRVPPVGADHAGRTLPRATVSSRKSTRRRCRRITWFLLHLMMGLVGLKCNLAMKVTKTLYVTTRKAWRAWLSKHHRRAEEIWLVFYRKESGKPRIAYNDAVEEALCFGWIDSTRSEERRVGKECRSRWSPEC